MKHFRVISIDHLGFGKSDRPDFNFDDFETSMNFFVLPIVQIIKLLDLKKLLIVGHSYSGLIASHLVPRVKQRVLGVWLVSPAGFNKRVFTELEKKKLFESYGKTFRIGSELMELIVYLTFEKVGGLLFYAITQENLHFQLRLQRPDVRVYQPLFQAKRAQTNPRRKQTIHGLLPGDLQQELQCPRIA